MKYKTFTIPCLPGEGVRVEEMDAFMAAHNVVNIEKKFYQTGDGMGCWAFCMGYLDYGTTRFAPSDVPIKKFSGEKIDYSKILQEEQYKKFEKYKEIRKELSKNAAVPPYSIFNDYELSEIAKLDEPNEKNITEIKGISKNKAEKYGKTLLEKYAFVSTPLNDRIGADA